MVIIFFYYLIFYKKLKINKIGPEKILIRILCKKILNCRYFFFSGEECRDVEEVKNIKKLLIIKKKNLQVLRKK